MLKKFKQAMEAIPRWYYDPKRVGATVLSKTSGTPEYRGEKPISYLRGTLTVFGRFNLDTAETKRALGDVLAALEPKRGRRGWYPGEYGRFGLHKELKSRWTATAVDRALLELLDLGWAKESLGEKKFYRYTITKEGIEALDRWRALNAKK